MKSVKISLPRPSRLRDFHIHYLGLHERMPPNLVNRPNGTGDYLMMLFHSKVKIRSRKKVLDWPASSLMIWTPKDGHYYGTEDGPWDHSWFHFDGRDVPDILKASRLSLGVPFPLTDTSLMERYLLETIAELNSWTEPDEIILRDHFEIFIRNMARQHSGKAGQLPPERLLEIKRHLGENFHQTLRLKELARRAGWSVPHLCTEFKRVFGVPVIQYVLQLRMNQAAYLLHDKNRTISEIAETVGYPDLYTFSRMFKRSFGLSPRNFRQKQNR